jgi:predicted ribosomally synthesized peptide with nif11-like leader
MHMSLDDARAFLEKLANDSGFRREAESALTADGFWALITRQGFEFTREEFLAAQQDQDKAAQAPEAGHDVPPCLDPVACSSREEE